MVDIPIAACNVDDGQDNLVRKVVEVDYHPTNALILLS
jgi:hypothetical protein